MEVFIPSVRPKRLDKGRRLVVVDGRMSRGGGDCVI